MKEEIIFGVINEYVSIFAQWSIDDRKSLASMIARILDAVEKSELELKRKVASEETLAKLALMKEKGVLQNKLGELSWYKFSERREIRFKILALEAKLI